MKISVIICTHNPRHDYLSRTLEGLKSQTLSNEHWELLLIDNTSREPLAAAWDLTWHPHAHHIREEELGLTPARLRGISESIGDLLVFVDDDNVLDSRYLEIALELAMTYPLIGAFGGSTVGEYEIPAPDDLKHYVSELGDIAVDRDYWSNLPGRSIATPVGAGLCVRRHIAANYAITANNSPLRKMLGRSGTMLLAGEDLDLAWCAIDTGMGTARFKGLKLIHLIPQRRICADYIVRLYAGYAASSVILATLRPDFYPLRGSKWKARIRFIIAFLRVSGVQRRIMFASRRACRSAEEMLSKFPG